MSFYGEFLLLDDDNGDNAPETVERLRLGDTSGKNEAWLRDALLAHPELLPVGTIDPSFGPLIPLGREVRCEAGRIDALFVNQHGRLTVVECKLWRNPQARREVIAQTLDYASALSRWDYSRLQAEVVQATGQKDKTPFALVKAQHPELDEASFSDALSRNLRDGRFLLVVAGDGIKENVEQITYMVQRNAALGFTFALVEMALYGLEDGKLLMQPRTVCRTHQILKTFTRVQPAPDEPNRNPLQADQLIDHDAEFEAQPDAGQQESPKQAEYRDWWAPVLQAGLRDKRQDPPTLHWPNHIRTQLPWPGTWITCYRQGNTLGVYTAGRGENSQALLQRLASEIPMILEEIGDGVEHRKFSGNDNMTIISQRDAAEFASEPAKHAWLSETLNKFCDALRDRVARVSPSA